MAAASQASRLGSVGGKLGIASELQGREHPQPTTTAAAVVWMPIGSGFELSAGQLIPPVWRFERSDGTTISDRFRMLPNGRVVGHSNANESNWAIKDGRLELRSGDGHTTTVFDEAIETGGILRLRGRFRAPFAWMEVVHVLRPNMDDLRVEADFAGFERPVFIAFGSHGRPYDPLVDPTMWEFFHLPMQERWNRIRLAERIDPHFWYLNKTARVIRLLSAMLDATTGPIALCGISSGGFAALLFGELLGRRFPDRQITTFSINPQTTHGAKHQAILEREVEPVLWPVFIEPDAFAQADLPWTSIADVASLAPGRRDGVRHIIFYDSGNPAEAYYCEPLARLPGFHLKAYDLGVPHATGIRYLYQTGDVHAGVRKALA